MKSIRLIAFALTLLLLALLAGATYLSRQAAVNYVHPGRARRAPGDTPARYGAVYQDITLRTQDGLELSAWYAPPSAASAASADDVAILVAHGYGSQRSAQMFAVFARHGYGVIAWDARAHGASGGDTCTLGYLEALDAQAALDYVLRQQGSAGVRAVRIGAYGESVGGAALLRAAAQRPEIAAVVADSTYSTLPDLFAHTVPLPIIHPLIRAFAEQEAGLSLDAMRPVAEIARLSPRPVFIIQGEADTVIPADSARRLYAAAGEPRQLWTSPGARHIGMRGAQPDEYDRRVLEFFDTYLLEK